MKNKNNKYNYVISIIKLKIMETLLEKYDLNTTEFKNLLLNTKSVIAGSSVLSIINKNEFEPNDIDIWIYGNTVDIDKYESKYVEFLINSGYTRDLNCNNDQYRKKYLEGIPSITRKSNTFYVKNFIKNNKIIQLIFIKIPFFDLVKKFDLSVCACWAVYSSDKFKYYCLDIENTSNHKMYFQQNLFSRVSCFNFKTSNIAKQNRLNHYLMRGYTICKPAKRNWLKFGTAKNNKKYEDCEIFI